jgi:hypothetical protein
LIQYDGQDHFLSGQRRQYVKISAELVRVSGGAFQAASNQARHEAKIIKCGAFHRCALVAMDRAQEKILLRCVERGDVAATHGPNKLVSSTAYLALAIGGSHRHYYRRSGSKRWLRDGCGD